MFLISINHKEFAKVSKQRDLFSLEEDSLSIRERNTQSWDAALPSFSFECWV